MSVSSSQTPISPERAPGEVGLLDLVAILVRRWRLVVGLPLAAGVLAAIYSLVATPTYRATTTFVPEQSSGTKLPGNLAGLAGQFGVSLDMGGGSSPQFYAAMVRSRELMEQVLVTPYADPREEAPKGAKADLLKILEVEGENRADSLEDGVRQLYGLTTVRVDDETDIVRLSVDSRYPDLAAAVANRYVVLLNKFNAESRQTQAGQRRRFLEERLDEGRQQLREAEDALRGFQEANRGWQQSPTLSLQEARLRRQMQTRQEVYQTLNREFLSARIEEVNNTPLITVVDGAVPPQTREAPKRKLVVLVSMLLGAVAAVAAAFALEFLARARHREPGEFEELSRAVRTLRRREA